MICFFDTNVLVYCMDAGDPMRQARAIDRFARACEQDTVVLSAQVLQEFYAITTRKLKPPLPLAEALAQMERLANFEVLGSSAGHSSATPNSTDLYVAAYRTVDEFARDDAGNPLPYAERERFFSFLCATLSQTGTPESSTELKERLVRFMRP